jgi:hypothetical protein
LLSWLRGWLGVVESKDWRLEFLEFGLVEQGVIDLSNPTMGVIHPTYAVTYINTIGKYEYLKQLSY